jgi:5-formyltetrahydrofolate cyclo-ligase
MGMHTPASKEAERRRQKARRRELSEEYWRRVGASISDRVVELIRPQLLVAGYAALAGEPILTDLPFVSLYPRVEGAALRFHRCEFDALEPGAFGVLEPPATAPLGAPEVVLVPGQAFTKDGARLGRGAGFYDRFFARSDALRIGVTDEAGLCPQLRTEAHDAHMDFVVTERRSLAVSTRV